VFLEGLAMRGSPGTGHSAGVCMAGSGIPERERWRENMETPETLEVNKEKVEKG
jgi:hypothetical protein